MIDCRCARDIVTRRALGEAVVADDVAAARSHVTGCAACRDYLGRFSRAIASRDPNEVSCAEVRVQLDSAWAKSDVSPGMERVHQHLAVCSACAAEAKTWQFITALEAQGALAEPPRYPVFDLSFLPHTETGEIWTTICQGVRRLAFEIPAALALAGKTLLSPPPGLAFSYASMQAARRGATGSENLVSISVDDARQDVRIAMDVTEANKALWLAVKMRTLSSGRVLDGAHIALCNEQGQAQEIKTVRPGESEARFPNIAPGRYMVRIQRSGQTWELPLSL